jgi:hypothetical protein
VAHKNAEKGKRWERWCATFLGITRRRNIGAHHDIGDLADPDFIYECKDDNSRSPVQWWAQAEAARERAHLPWSIVLAKTAALTGKPKRPEEPHGWATQSIEQWRVMREYLRWLETSFDGIYGGAGPALRANALRSLREVMDYRVANGEMSFPFRPPPDGEGESVERDLLVPSGRDLWRRADSDYEA